MCLLIHKPADVTFSEEELRDFYLRNSDGFGVMYAEDGKLKYAKELGSVKDWLKFYKKHEQRHACFHLRMQTHGDIDLTNCHPYEISGFEELPDGPPLLLMHNGVLMTGNDSDRTKSDTWHYIREFLRPMLLSNPEFAMSGAFADMVGSHIGSSNKFAIMDAQGRVQIVNKRTGVHHKGAWFSNTYAWSASKFMNDPYGGYYRNSHDRKQGYWSGGKWHWFEDDDDRRYENWKKRTSTLNYGRGEPTGGQTPLPFLTTQGAMNGIVVPAKSKNQLKREAKRAARQAKKRGGSAVSSATVIPLPMAGTRTTTAIGADLAADVMEMRAMIDTVYPENHTKDSDLEMLLTTLGVTRSYHTLELMFDRKIKPSMWDNITASARNASIFGRLPMKTLDAIAVGKYADDPKYAPWSERDDGFAGPGYVNQDPDTFATAEIPLAAQEEASA